MLLTFINILSKEPDMSYMGLAKSIKEALTADKQWYCLLLQNGQTERWWHINYPNFSTMISNISPKSWKYVSSEGRLLSSAGHLFESRGCGYQHTNLLLTKDGALGDVVKISVHRIVACTFLGRSRSEVYTVDHINCVKRDKSVRNLRWLDPSSQLENQRYGRYSSSRHT